MTAHVSLPPAPHASVDTLAEPLVDYLRRRRVLILSGAGCSTESGIPDYRGPDGTLRHREPMRFQVFMGSPEARVRYWARSFRGWPRFDQARPNPAHQALAGLEAAGVVAGVVTQNVDGLHQAAGSCRVVDLHGRLARVRCTRCRMSMGRWEMQEELTELNPDFSAAVQRLSADGDAELEPGAEEGFQVPACLVCDGVLKPDVVFFGESVPEERVEAAWALYQEADAVLVVGSSLAVFSGRRFVLRAAREDRPVAILNMGPTRSDEGATLKVEGRVGQVLPRVLERLAAEG